MPHPHFSPAASPGLTRRQLLGGLATVGLGLAAPVLWAPSPARAVQSLTTTTDASGLPAWSSPDTWGGQVPGPDEVVTVSVPIRLDVDARVKGLVIASTGHLAFDPEQDITLASDGNVEVYGTLEMCPETAANDHLLLFPTVDESSYVGGGMDVLASDVGLWVRDCGRLVLEGTPRTAWVRANEGLQSGASTIRLAAVPSGWRVGDELVVTPTGAPTDDLHYDRFDEVTIRSISGDVVTLERPLRYAHPAVEIGDGLTLTAEVLNLTRNVRVEGTPSGRTHTNVHACCEVSVIRYTAFRHFGPRKPDSKNEYTDPVLGRYGLHWHMNGDCSRGTVVEGVVARDGGNHAFVAHESHGVGFTSCISYSTAETPYWWDLAANTRAEPPPSHDVVYDSCVAAKVIAVPWFRGYDMAGFRLSEGHGNIARHCVATGVRGRRLTSGFRWGRTGIWEFTNCVSHNNAVDGIHTWQNTWQQHVIDRFVAYHNGDVGLRHGAYRNGYVYSNAILYGNGAAGIALHANSRDDVILTFDNILIDGAGISPYAIKVLHHRSTAQAPTSIRRCRFRGYTEAAIAVTAEGPDNAPKEPDLLDVTRCTFSGNEFWFSPEVPTASRVRVQSGRLGSLLLRPASVPRGRLRPQWNAKVRTIAPFASHGRPQPASITVAARSTA